MQYGYFDEKTREYVISRPVTPAPWMNILGTLGYTAVISNNAAGYSYRRSAAKGRILRSGTGRADTPGRYLYIRDNKSRDYWSASWQPVGKDLRRYISECRHGLGYTTMRSEYDNIRTDSLFYVPLSGNYEVWYLKVSNRSEEIRHLTVTGFAEFTNDPDPEQDLRNPLRSQFVSQTRFQENRIVQTVTGREELCRFFGLAGAEVSSYCGDLSAFLGPYRGYAQPLGVVLGDLRGKLNYNENSCGALSGVIILKPGESADMAFLLGEMPEMEAEEVIRRYADPLDVCREELVEIKEWWEKRLGRLRVKTPDEMFRVMCDTWDPAHCLRTFLQLEEEQIREEERISPAILRELEGLCRVDPELAEEWILRLLEMAGAEDAPGLVPVIYRYIAETGKTELLHRRMPSAGAEEKAPAEIAEEQDLLQEAEEEGFLAAAGDSPFAGEKPAEEGAPETAETEEGIPAGAEEETAAVPEQETLYGWLKDALQACGAVKGSHGLPLLQKQVREEFADPETAEVEQVPAAMLYFRCLGWLKEMAVLLGREEDTLTLEEERNAMREVFRTQCHQIDRYVHGFRKDGSTVGTTRETEGSLWLEPQVQSILSGLTEGREADALLELIGEELNTPWGAMNLKPPYKTHLLPGRRWNYNEYTGENGGILTQSQSGLIRAEAMRGHGEKAWTLYRAVSPASLNEQAEIRVGAPYCYGEFTEGAGSPRAGRSHLFWSPGAASAMMEACLEGILGMQPTLKELVFSPAIPAEWEELEVERTFRGKKLHIVYKNPRHAESGVKSLVINNTPMTGSRIPYGLLLETNEIEVEIGR